MNKNIITNEILDKSTLIKNFKKSLKEEKETNYDLYKEKVSEINENFRLDCAEFDDNIQKHSSKKEKFIINLTKDIETFDKVNGVEYYNSKIENDKKEVIKEFVDNLNNEKEAINRLISDEDKEFELNYKEKNDQLFSLEKETKNKLTEAKKKLTLSVKKEENARIKKCDEIEKTLLQTNDLAEIKDLLEKQKEIRLESLKKINEIKVKYYEDVKELKTLQANQKIDGILELSNFKNQAIKIKNGHRRDIDEIIEKIKAREDYYIQISANNGIKYFEEQIDVLTQKKTKANDDCYLIEKDILNVRIKQIKFIEKEFASMYKKIATVVVSQIDGCLDAEKPLIDLIKRYVGYFDSKFKLLDNDPKDKKELLSTIKEIVELIVESNEVLVTESPINEIACIEYINFPIDSLKEGINSIYYVNKTEVLELLNGLINSEDFESQYSDIMKSLHGKINSLYKDLKNFVKEYVSIGKEFVSEICKEKNLQLNNDTIVIDDKFTTLKVVDNLLFDNVINSYKNEIDKFNKAVANQNVILSTIGNNPDKQLEEKNKKVDKEYDELINANKKSLSETLKTIDKDHKESLNKCESNLKEMISRL